MAGLDRNRHDHDMKRHLRDAERALRQAADLCVHVTRINQKEGRERSASRHALVMQHEIEQILGKLSSLGRIVPLNLDNGVEEETARIRREMLAKKQRTERSQVKRVTDGTED